MWQNLVIVKWVLFIKGVCADELCQLSLARLRQVNYRYQFKTDQLKKEVNELLKIGAEIVDQTDDFSIPFTPDVAEKLTSLGIQGVRLPAELWNLLFWTVRSKEVVNTGTVSWSLAGYTQEAGSYVLVVDKIKAQ